MLVSNLPLVCLLLRFLLRCFYSFRSLQTSELIAATNKSNETRFFGNRISFKTMSEPPPLTAPTTVPIVRDSEDRRTASAVSLKRRMTVNAADVTRRMVCGGLAGMIAKVRAASL